MDRPQSGHENQRRKINSRQQNDRADFAHRVEQQRLSEKVADPSARALNVEDRFPTLQMTRLQLQQTRAGSDEQNDPGDPRRYAQTRVKQFCHAEPE